MGHAKFNGTFDFTPFSSYYIWPNFHILSY